MMAAATPQGYPLGLYKLASSSRVFISQKDTVFANKYVVTTGAGDLLFNAKEDASALHVWLDGDDRKFYIDLYDANQQQVISLRRPYTFGVSKLEVSVCGRLVSVVRQQCTMMKPVLHINNAHDQPVLRVKGPITVEPQCNFKLQTSDKKEIGFIRKKWSGLMREVFTESTDFEIEFPIDLDVNYKAAVIGTCLLIDFLYYEK